jgi:2-polyprenyl-6-methoxyphenol hydroxylase-like FAD-dependent oxidoreductase
MIGRHAVVVGAGLAGLTAARAVADSFEHVLILERDALPEGPADRTGVPQGRHVHVVLAGGEQALERLFPGFGPELRRLGAVPMRVGMDLLAEVPGYDPFPRRDLGWDDYWMSRALIESVVRERVRALPNVRIRDHCRVEAVMPRTDGSRIDGLQLTDRDGRSETITSDLVIDASGQGVLTLRLLESVGEPAPRETTIGIDMAYSTAIFAIPEPPPDDWKGVFCLPDVPRSSRGALLAPLEGRRWILTLAGRGAERPPTDIDGFLNAVRQLRTPTIHDAIRNAKRLTDVVAYRFPESRLRHFEESPRFPTGVLPIGDAICRFNPIYGQGMSLAAQEAVALQRVLATRGSEGLEGIAPTLFSEVRALIDTPWSSAALPDLAYPDARGERPADFEQRLTFSAGMRALAANDPAVHKLTSQVQHLLKPRSVYRDPELVRRVLGVIASGRKG